MLYVLYSILWSHVESDLYTFVPWSSSSLILLPSGGVSLAYDGMLGRAGVFYFFKSKRSTRCIAYAASMYCVYIKCSRLRIHAIVYMNMILSCYAGSQVDRVARSVPPLHKVSSETQVPGQRMSSGGSAKTYQVVHVEIDCSFCKTM